MNRHRAARNRACVLLAAPSACGPTVGEPLAEEGIDEYPLHRGPVTLLWGDGGDCIGPIVPDGQSPNEACLSRLQG